MTAANLLKCVIEAPCSITRRTVRKPLPSTAISPLWAKLRNLEGPQSCFGGATWLNAGFCCPLEVSLGTAGGTARAVWTAAATLKVSTDGVGAAVWHTQAYARLPHEKQSIIGILNVSKIYHRQMITRRENVRHPQVCQSVSHTLRGAFPSSYLFKSPSRARPRSESSLLSPPSLLTSLPFLLSTASRTIAQPFPSILWLPTSSFSPCQISLLCISRPFITLSALVLHFSDARQGTGAEKTKRQGETAADDWGSADFHPHAHPAGAAATLDRDAQPDSGWKSPHPATVLLSADSGGEGRKEGEKGGKSASGRAEVEELCVI